MTVTYDPGPVPVGDPLEEYDPVVFVSDAVSDGPLFDDEVTSILVEETVPDAESDNAPLVCVALAEDGFVDPDLVDDVGLPEDVEDVGVDPAVP